MTLKQKLETLEYAIKDCEDKYPMTGKPDKEAAYKNGWYDCAFHLSCLIKKLK